MRNLCVLCHKIHESPHWKYGEYEIVDGKRYGWFCSKWYIPSSSPEFTTEQIRDSRKEYFNSMVQPYRGGEVSKEYIEAHGAKHIDPKEVKKAKYVWKDLPGWSNRHKSK